MPKDDRLYKTHMERLEYWAVYGTGTGHENDARHCTNLCSFTRGPTGSGSSSGPKEPRDTTTLRG
jgi:hypothetical protein